MKVFRTVIGEVGFKLAIVHKEDEMVKGLSKRKNMKMDAGMLFVFPGNQHVVMNTYDMQFDIDMYFMDSKFKILKKTSVQIGENVDNNGVMYVLETKVGAFDSLGDKTFEEGDIMDINDDPDIKAYLDKIKGENPTQNIIIRRINDVELFKKGGRIVPKERAIKAKKFAMQVLDDEGIILMNIKGGERIFSRDHTQKIIEYVKDVKAGVRDPKELGALMARMIEIQDTQEAEYVEE